MEFEHEVCMPTVSSPNVSPKQTPEGKCSRVEPSGVCLGLEAVVEVDCYMKTHAIVVPSRHGFY